MHFYLQLQKKYTLVEKGMLLPHWTSANMASSSRSNSSGGVAASAIMKFTYYTKEKNQHTYKQDVYTKYIPLLFE